MKYMCTMCTAHALALAVFCTFPLLFYWLGGLHQCTASYSHRANIRSKYVHVVCCIIMNNFEIKWSLFFLDNFDWIIERGEGCPEANDIFYRRAFPIVLVDLKLNPCTLTIGKHVFNDFWNRTHDILLHASSFQAHILEAIPKKILFLKSTLQWCAWTQVTSIWQLKSKC